MGFLSTIVRNLGLKIVGVILALLLWFHVATNREYDITLPYTLSYAELAPEVVMTATPPEEMGVRLRASGKQLLRLWWSDRKWPVDLSHATTGEMTINLRPDQVPRFGIENVRVLGLDQQGRLSLWLDSLTTKSVPVYTEETFFVASGYIRTGSVALTPSVVQLTGPRALLDGIDRVELEPIGRSEWDEPINQEIAVTLPVGHNLLCAPSSVRVSQHIEPFVIKEYDSLPVAIVMIGSHIACTVDPPWVTVEVGGPESRMADLTADSVRVIYAASREDTSGARCALWVNVPAPFQVLKVEPDSITVYRDGTLRTDSGT